MSNIELKLFEILDKIERMEKTFISINADLINQNIKMSEMLNGKLKEPDFPDNNNNNDKSENNEDNKNNKKDLYYFEKNNLIVVYGPGTFDNKDVLKSIGSWNSFNKTWDLTIDKNVLYEKFPNIIEKVKV